MLQDELDRRRSRLLDRRFKRSGLAERLTLADFDWRFKPKLPRAACFELHTLKFVAEGANALVIGKPGTGKSHVAKAMAYQATLSGYDVRYVEADTEFARYGLASAAEQAQQLKEWVEADLLVLEEPVRRYSRCARRPACGAPPLASASPPPLGSPCTRGGNPHSQFPGRGARRTHPHCSRAR